MTEHLITDEINRYLKREMPPAELLTADDHLAQCDACFQKVKDLSGDAADFQPDFSEETQHLSYEQLENYADEKTDDVESEITDVHLKACEHCRAELAGLIEMRELIKADLQKQSLPEKPTNSWLENIFSGGFVLKLGFAALGLAIFALAIFLLSKRGENVPEIAQQTPSRSNVNSQTVQTPAPPANSQVNVEADTPPNTNANLQNQPPTEEKTNDFPPAYQAEIERVLAANRLNLPAELSELKGQSGKLMSGGSDSVPFALETPLGKIIQTDRPEFRWRALAGANGYVVNVYDTNFNRIAGSPQVKATNWQTDRPLQRNKIYIWQVTALKDGQEIKSPVRPAPDAKFKVLDAARTTELARLSREYKNEHLALGILYANAGLLTEAAREFQRELAVNPNSKQARKFLQDVRAKR